MTILYSDLEMKVIDRQEENENLIASLVKLARIAIDLGKEERHDALVEMQRLAEDIHRNNIELYLLKALIGEN